MKTEISVSSKGLHRKHWEKNDTTEFASTQIKQGKKPW